MVESIQARFVRYLCSKKGIRRSIPDYGDRIRHFGLLSLKERRIHSDLLTLYKIANGLLDAQLIEDLKFRFDRRSKRHHRVFEIPISTLNTTYI